MQRRIEARYAPAAAAEREAARQAYDQAHQPAPSRVTWNTKAVAGEPLVKRLTTRERDRVLHLVLERDRPRVTSGKGRGKHSVPVALHKGVEAAVQLRETYGHKRATPETLRHFHENPEGALRRLLTTGAIDQDQMNSAEAIAAIAELIGADVTVRTASLEARVDVTRRGDGGFFEKLGRVRAEIAYGYWRAHVARLGPIGAVLDMVVGETVGFTVVAKRYGMHHRRAKKLLLDALDAWPAMFDRARREVSSADLAAAHAGIM